MKVGFNVEILGNGEPPRVGAVHSVGDMADYNAWCRGVSYAEDAVYQGDEILGVNGENWDTVELLMSETREAERLFWMSSTSFRSLRRASSPYSGNNSCPKPRFGFFLTGRCRRARAD